MEVVSPGQGPNGHTPSSPATIDPDLVLQHLVDLLEVTLGASTEDLESKGSLLSDVKRRDTVQRCTRFASESQVALYVQKDIIAAETSNGVQNGHGSSGTLPIKSLPAALLMSIRRAFCPLRLLAFIRDLILLYHRCFRCPHKAPAAYRPTDTSSHANPGHQSSWCGYSK